MRPDEQDDQSEALIELYEEGVNAIEQMAQAIVAQIRTLIQHRARYEPVDASDFPERDIGFYNRTMSELSALGFTMLGDFEQASPVVTDPSRRTFVRFAVGHMGGWHYAHHPPSEAQTEPNAAEAAQEAMSTR